MRILALAVSLTLALTTTAAPQRATEIAGAFSKTKHKQKERYGVKKSLYVDVRSRAEIRPLAQYSGHYSTDFDYTLTLQVRADGVVTGSGTDRGAFTLRNARVQDALLTATKVYANGATEPFEGAFLTRTVRSGTAPDRITSESSAFGLGVVNVDVAVAGNVLDKIFYERK